MAMPTDDYSCRGRIDRLNLTGVAWWADRGQTRRTGNWPRQRRPCGGGCWPRARGSGRTQRAAAGAPCGTRCWDCRRRRWRARSPRTTRSAPSRVPTGLVYALWKRGTYVLLPLLRAGRATWTGPPTRARTRCGRGRAGCRAGRAAARPGRDAPAPTSSWSPPWRWTGTGMRLGRGGGSYDRALARVGRRYPDDRPALRRRTARLRCPPARTTSGSGWWPAPGSRDYSGASMS